MFALEWSHSAISWRRKSSASEGLNLGFLPVLQSDHASKMLKELLRFLLSEGYCPAVTKALLSTREAWTYCRESREGQLKWFKDWSTSPVRKTETAGRREGSGDLINLYKYLKGRSKEERARLFLLVPTLRSEATGTHWTIRGSLNIKETLLQWEDERALVQAAQRGRAIPIPGETWRPFGDDSEQLAVNGLDQIVSRDPFPLQLFCYCVSFLSKSKGFCTCNILILLKFHFILTPQHICCNHTVLEMAVSLAALFELVMWQFIVKGLRSLSKELNYTLWMSI